MKKYLFAGLTAVAGVALSNAVFAAGWSSVQLIDKLRLTSNGDTLVIGKGKTWKNPDGCKNSKSAVLPGDAQYFPEMYATLLVAQTRATKVKLHLSGCTKLSSTTYPTVRMIEKY